MRQLQKDSGNVLLPFRRKDPIYAVLRRLLLAIVLIAFVALMVRVDDDGYRDANGDGVSTLDAFYYATVSVTTTGYGDIVPTTNGARLLSTSIVTLARVVFLVLLVGTTFEVATEHGRYALRQKRWRRNLRDHTIICGFGTTGNSAAKALLAEGLDANKIVVIDSERGRIEEAAELGLSGVVGDATRTATLKNAEAGEAASVIVAPNNDATAVLITLTARELNQQAKIAAAAKEERNAHLLRQSGANSVIVSSEASGRLLGISTYAPEVVEALEELLLPNAGLDLSKRSVLPGEVGSPPVAKPGEVVMAIKRGEVMHLASSAPAQCLESNDEILVITTAGHI